MSAIKDALEIAFALLTVFLWLRSGCHLPRYVHRLAALAFLLGAWGCLEIYIPGVRIVSILWLPFVFAGVTYLVFILHGAGISPEDVAKKPIGADALDTTNLQ